MVSFAITISPSDCSTAYVESTPLRKSWEEYFGKLEFSTVSISIAANKVPGIRAALCTSREHAIMSRKHNDANVLALGARFTDMDMIKVIVKAWIDTEFEGGRHLTRREKIEL